ncbi:MAG TPA: hypothetical protein VLG46_16635, partial [Anaerolineae bacterium]|nr:hypothetical protein [Anaerolineae bacterium]
MLHTRQAARPSLAFLSCCIVLTLILTACGAGAAPTTAPAQPTREPVAQPTEAGQPSPTEPPATTQPTEEPPAKTEPTVLHIGWLGKPDTLNPAYAFLTESYIIFDLIFNPLITEDPSGKYVGALAKEWKASEDGLTWT